jgi:hypothetical protein
VVLRRPHSPDQTGRVQIEENSAVKCSYHPEVDAVGVCTNCGRMICPDCGLQLRDRTYCKPCANEIFAAKLSPKSTAEGRSGLLKAGGILSILAGVMGLLTVVLPLAMIIFLPLLLSAREDDFDASYSFVLLFFVPFIAIFGILSTLAIVGGICALKRERWGLALGGAICGAVASSVLGILAVVFIAMSRDEFKKKPSRS